MGMEHSIAVYIVAIVILLIFSGYFSATETAFTSLNRVRLKNAASDGDARARLVLDLAEEFDKVLSTILIGNNIVNITMTAVATVLFVDLYGSYGATIATIVTTVIVLIFGEISPKSIAKERPEAFAKFAAPLLRVNMVIFTPLTFIFKKWKVLITKIFNLEADHGITEEELLTMVEEAETEGGIDEEQSELIQNAIEFNELDALDVLTPRTDLVAIDIETEAEEVGKIFKYTGFSRLPVYEDDLDNILGVINQKDFHNFVVAQDKGISDVIKPVVFVAPSMKIAALLKKLQAAKSHMAIIVDEYGGTMGIVTMEDIIEELVGEIYDEHDGMETQEILELQDGSYRILCSANLDKMFDYFDVSAEMDVTTVNGWVVVVLDKLPQVGDTFDYRIENKVFHVKVTKADDRRAIEIHMVLEELAPDDVPEEERKEKVN
jgi:CBS domain containing-hemolysin-like protein